MVNIAQETASQERLERFSSEVARRHVAGYIAVPVSDWSLVPPDEEKLLIEHAERVFVDQPQHPCYWNNRFPIAVLCRLSEEKQRRVAWMLVTNGVNGYWEWETHSGYRMYGVLHHLGILENDMLRTVIRREFGYSSPPLPLLEAIAKKFTLPTTFFDQSRQLSQEEQREREVFNAQYPWHHEVGPVL